VMGQPVAAMRGLRDDRAAEQQQKQQVAHPHQINRVSCTSAARPEDGHSMRAPVGLGHSKGNRSGDAAAYDGV
jgi:hypothetical protein